MARRKISTLERLKQDEARLDKKHARLTAQIDKLREQEHSLNDELVGVETERDAVAEAVRRIEDPEYGRTLRAEPGVINIHDEAVTATKEFAKAVSEVVGR